jgi:hypothetical protein
MDGGYRGLESQLINKINKINKIKKEKDKIK